MEAVLKVEGMSRSTRRFWRRVWRSVVTTAVLVVAAGVSSLHLLDTVRFSHHLEKWGELISAGEWFLAVVMFITIAGLTLFVLWDNWIQSDFVRRCNYRYSDE